MRVAVTGGTGIVGRFIVDHLTGEGHEARVLVRPQSDRNGFARQPSFVTGSLGDTQSFRALLEGADALVHCALSHAPGRYRGGEGDDLTAFLDENLLGSVGLMSEARRLGVERCVVLSSRAVFSASPDGRPLDERHPTRPDTHYGAMKAALEAFAASFAAEHGWTVAALRPTGVYGVTHPFERTKWLGLVRAVMAQEGGLPVRSGTEVHGLDVARAVSLLLAAPARDIAGQVFNVSDLYLSTRRIAETVQGLTGARGPLPDERFDPSYAVMSCGRIERLGLSFGGWPLFRATLADICARLAGSCPDD
jgi:UDP-glucose 4-epimerase